MRLRRAGERTGERVGERTRSPARSSWTKALTSSPSTWVCGEAADGSMSVVASSMRENVVDDICGMMRNIMHVRGAHLLVPRGFILHHRRPPAGH